MWRKEDVLKELKRRRGTQTLRAYADTVGCSAGYLHDVLNGRREPSGKLLDHLGLEAVTVTTVKYVRKQRRWR